LALGRDCHFQFNHIVPVGLVFLVFSDNIRLTVLQKILLLGQGGVPDQREGEVVEFNRKDPKGFLSQVCGIDIYH